MKKLLYTSLIALAGLFAASCQQEHIEVVYDPANVTVQTLGVFADAELAADGAALTTTFNPADFKLNVASGYTLYASKAADMADKVKVSSSISIDENKIGHISIKQPAMNSLIYSLGGAAEEPFTVYFQLEGGITNDKNATIAATVVNSNVVAATFTPYSTIILDKDLYPHVYPIGGIDILGSWSHEKVFQFTYDYNKSGDTFTGLLDLGEKHADGVQFKFTGDASWDDSTGNWGVDDDAAPEAEASELQLKNGSNTNITQYGKDRFYMFSLNTSTLVLSKKYSFSNVGIVGAFNGWNQADPDMKMTYNIYLHRFYIDQTFAENTELKFTCDDKWDLNWGGNDGEIAGGGSNIAVEAGSYRVYLDLNHGTYELSTAMYGKDEPTGQEDQPEPEPEPVVVTGWNIIGLNGDWDNDVLATQNGNVWSAYITATADTEFKWRKDGGWDENYGGVMTALGEPFEAVAGGDNIKIGAGFYKVELDTETLTITVSEGHVWSLIGDFNSWNGDVDMTESDGVWTSPVTKLSGGFKIRYNHAWDTNVGGTMLALGEPFEAVAGGDNISVEEGNYIVTYDSNAGTITVDEMGWGLVGTINNWGETPDIILKEEGLFLVARNVTLTADDQIKIRYSQSWDNNRGGASVLGVPVKAVAGGDNIKPGVAGSYDVYYRPDCEVILVNEAGSDLAYWGVVGTINEWSAPDIIMYQNADGLLESSEIKLLAADKFKIRKNEDWTVNRGGSFAELDTAFDAVDGGSDIALGRDATIQVIYDAAAEKITIKGQFDGDAPAFKSEITVAGDYSGCGWSIDNDPKLQGENGVYKGALVMNGGSFKFVHNGTWIGGTATDLTYALTPNAGDNMTIADGTYFWTVNLAAESPVATALAVTKVGLIGKFNGWSDDVELTFDATTLTYTGNVTLVEDDEIKVRFNGNWDYALGGSAEKLSAYGGNIAVADAGTYKAVVNLNKGTLTLTPAN